jgi:hypothetical protein
MTALLTTALAVLLWPDRAVRRRPRLAAVRVAVHGPLISRSHRPRQPGPRWSARC